MTVARKVLPLFLLMLLWDMPAQAATWTTIDVPGSTWTYATGINGAGDLVGYYFAGTVHGFLIKDGNLSTIDVPGSLSTAAWDINDAGQISGSFQGQDGLNHGFVFDGVNYTTLDFPGVADTSALGIKNAGEVVGYYDDSSGKRHGFTWSNGTYATVDVGSKITELHGIDNRGQIVGMYGHRRPLKQFVMNPQGRIQKFAFPGLGFTDINDHKIVVGYEGNEGFRLNLGTNKIVSMQFPGGFSTACVGINQTKQIVGNYYDGIKYRGFVRTP